MKKTADFGKQCSVIQCGKNEESTKVHRPRTHQDHLSFTTQSCIPAARKSPFMFVFSGTSFLIDRGGNIEKAYVEAKGKPTVCSIRTAPSARDTFLQCDQTERVQSLNTPVYMSSLIIDVKFQS